MSNVLTDWRTYLQTLISTTFSANNVKIIVGDWTGPSRDFDRACVFANPYVPDGSDVNDARPRMTIRYWKQLEKTNIRDVPNDPAPIEQLMVDLAQMLQPHLTNHGVSGLSYFHVDSITPDYNDEYGVEVLLTGWSRNLAEAGG